MPTGDKRGTKIETQLKLRHLSFSFCPQSISGCCDISPCPQSKTKPPASTDLELSRMTNYPSSGHVSHLRSFRGLVQWLEFSIHDTSYALIINTEPIMNAAKMQSDTLKDRTAPLDAPRSLAADLAPTHPCQARTATSTNAIDGQTPLKIWQWIIPTLSSVIPLIHFRTR